jgi:hypothetical protein
VDVLDSMRLRARNAGAEMIETGKIRCTECGWEGNLANVGEVTDPDPLPDTIPQTWRVCPACRTPENFRSLCDEPGCVVEVSRGTPTANGYRNTCHFHAPVEAP